LYTRYDSIDSIPSEELIKIEKNIFRESLDQIWSYCIDFFQQRDPEQINRAEGNPKRKMALIFRWYLGLSSNWANIGKQDRITDMQIWCGPSMGAFNDWVKGTELENFDKREAAVIAELMMKETALLYRIESLKLQGLIVPKEKLKQKQLLTTRT
jgi:PfaD family protein